MSVSENDTDGTFEAKIIVTNQAVMAGEAELRRNSYKQRRNKRQNTKPEYVLKTGRRKA